MLGSGRAMEDFLRGEDGGMEVNVLVMEVGGKEDRSEEEEHHLPTALFGLPNVVTNVEDEAPKWVRRGGYVNMWEECSEEGHGFQGRSIICLPSHTARVLKNPRPQWCHCTRGPTHD